MFLDWAAVNAYTFRTLQTTSFIKRHRSPVLPSWSESSPPSHRNIGPIFQSVSCSGSLMELGKAPLLSYRSPSSDTQRCLYASTGRSVSSPFIPFLNPRTPSCPSATVLHFIPASPPTAPVLESHDSRPVRRRERQTRYWQSMECGHSTDHPPLRGQEARPLDLVALSFLSLSTSTPANGRGCRAGPNRGTRGLIATLADRGRRPGGRQAWQPWVPLPTERRVRSVAPLGSLP